MLSSEAITTNGPVHFQASTFEKGSGCLTKLNNSGWNLLAEEVSFPIAVINQKYLLSNAQWMQSFSEQASVKLAPHGKTSMAPEFFKLQLEQGSWGISLATVPQVINAVEHGVERIILANQLVGTYHMNLIADLLINTNLEFYCFVDSVENVHALGRFFSDLPISLNVLIEIGVPQGRCGWRDQQNMAPLLDAIEQYADLRLCGISFYEGVIHGKDAAEEVIAFVNNVCIVVAQLHNQKKFDCNQVIITGAGSAWYDLVAQKLTSNTALIEINYLPIIRPGCYLIHDKGIYQSAQNEITSRSQLACDISGDLISNLELWAYVHSVPEFGLAIIGLGKRDVAFDAGLPIPEYVYRPGTKGPKAIKGESKVIKIMDQHCMLVFDNKTSLQPGDLIIFATSHPCLTMDKWRRIGLIDNDFIVQKTIETFF